MTDDERTDRLLRRHVPALEDEHAGGCLEAETIAAWHDGSLPSAARTAAEAHAAGCARCLTVLAAMARTEPDTRPVPWWSGWLGARWLVPLTAAATAVFLWVLVEQPRQPVSIVGQHEQQAAKSSDLAAESAPGNVRTAPGAPAASPQAAGDSMVPAAPEHDTRVEPGENVSANAARVTPPSELLELHAPARPLPEARERADGTGAEPLSDRAAAAPPPDAREEAASQTAFARTFAATGVEVVSPEPAYRWRVADDRIERSVDGGSTWQRQFSVARASLVAGTAPAPAVCWLVGREGLVLLSADGQTWARLSFPEPVDLVAVIATDGVHATVTTADSRSYRTADGGRSWTLQENPAAPF